MKGVVNILGYLLSDAQLKGKYEEVSIILGIVIVIPKLFSYRLNSPKFLIL